VMLLLLLPDNQSTLCPVILPFLVTVRRITNDCFVQLYHTLCFWSPIENNCHKCQDRRGPWPKRAQGRNKQDRTHERTPSLGKAMTRHISRGPAGWWPTGKILFFSASFIQKRKRLKHQKHSDLVTTFLCFSPCILTASVLD
jgi:hypothetical protein